MNTMLQVLKAMMMMMMMESMNVSLNFFCFVTIFLNTVRGDEIAAGHIQAHSKLLKLVTDTNQNGKLTSLSQGSHSKINESSGVGW